MVFELGRKTRVRTEDRAVYSRGSDGPTFLARSILDGRREAQGPVPEALILAVIGVQMLIQHQWTIPPAEKPMLEHRLVEAAVDQPDPGRSLTRPAFASYPWCCQ